MTKKAKKLKTDTKNQKANQTKNVSTFKFGDWMYDTDVVLATRGFLSQHPDKVRGVLVRDFANTLSTKKDNFTDRFKQLIKEALLELDNTKTRIVFTVHIGGNHYATVAYDRTENKAVIVEPMKSSHYKKYVNQISTLLRDIFKEPGFSVEICDTKIQHDTWICGFVSCKLVDHFLTGNSSIHDAIQEKHLPKEILNVKNDDGRKALVKEVQDAYYSQNEKINNINANNNTASEAMMLGLLNLVATNQLDSDKFKSTREKLLVFYHSYLISNNTKSNVAPPKKYDLTWDKFKAFVISQNSDESQRLLAVNFGHVLQEHLYDDRKGLYAFYRERMHQKFLNELHDFLTDNENDGQVKNYKRFDFVRKEFLRIRNDKNLKTEKEKIDEFNNSWRKERVSLLFLNEPNVERELPNQIDLAIVAEYFQNIDFNYGTKPNVTSNYYTSGYGDIGEKALIKIGLFNDKIINDLCDNQNGIIIEIAGRDNQRFFQFKRLANDTRLEKLKAILKKHPEIPVCASGNEENAIKDILEHVNPKSFHPTIKLKKVNDEWAILDKDVNHTWLKVSSLKSNSKVVKDQTKAETTTDTSKKNESTDKTNVSSNKKKTNKLSSIKIDFTKPEISMILKRTFGTMENAQSITSTNYLVNGNDIQVFENGFIFKNVTKEVIEATVKAMAAVFDEKNKTDKNNRVVKLTLTRENEKFRSDYQAELKKYNIILSNDKPNISQSENAPNKWAEHHKKMTEDQKSSENKENKENKKESNDSNKQDPTKPLRDTKNQNAHPHEPTLPVMNKPIGEDNGPNIGSRRKNSS